MAIRKRREEIERVVALLEDESFASAEDLAWAIIREVYDLFQARAWYGLKWGPMAYGPWADYGECTRAGARLQGLATVHTLRSVGSWMDLTGKYLDLRNPVYCPDCGHPTFAHSFPNHQGCVVRKPAKCICKRTY